MASNTGHLLGQRDGDRGVRFVSDPFDSSVCWRTICLDPDGNPLSLHHRYAPAG